jgi:hypothetical protein
MKSVIVTVSDEALTNIDQLADKLRKKGLKVERVLPITGVIAGAVAAAKVASMRKVQGVLSIEDELYSELPPPMH